MMLRDQIGDGAVVAEIDPFEPKTLAPSRDEQLAIGMGGHTLDLIVGRHDDRRIDRSDHLLEGDEVGLAQGALADVRGSQVEPPLWGGVNEMLKCDKNLVFRQRSRTALLPADGGDAHLRDEKGVLAEELLHSAVARIARQIQDRTQGDRGAPQPRLTRGDVEHLLDQLGVPGASQGRWDGEDRGVSRHQSMGGLFMEQGRNTEPRLFDQESLDRVHERYGLADIAESICPIAPRPHRV